MYNAVLPNLPSPWPPKSSVMCCGLYSGSALATSPNISLGFPLRFDSAIGQMCGLLQEPATQHYSFLGQEGRSSVCLGQAMKTLV